MYCMMTVKSMSIGKQSQNLDIFGNLETLARTCLGTKKAYDHPNSLTLHALWMWNRQSGKDIPVT